MTLFSVIGPAGYISRCNFILQRRGGGAGGQPTDHMEFDLVLVRQQRFDKNRYPFALLKSVVRFGEASEIGRQFNENSIAFNATHHPGDRFACLELCGVFCPGTQ